ncbi:hypothetical protein WMF45_29305 [Sorangium sp. So ce448]|uniref:hypothetical protein n=1 Tax=Sorangium sp. So ce448 TaxID=3133314 RepID=UPI003F5ED22D
MSLAAAAVRNSGARPWRAYLSTDTVDARDRIGAGPWFNRNGVMIAASVEALHDPAQNLIDKINGLDENGAQVPHTTSGCSAERFVQTGGAGRIYCFAAH